MAGRKSGGLGGKGEGTGRGGASLFIDERTRFLPGKFVPSGGGLLGEQRRLKKIWREGGASLWQGWGRGLRGKGSRLQKRAGMFLGGKKALTLKAVVKRAVEGEGDI